MKVPNPFKHIIIFTIALVLSSLILAEPVYFNNYLISDYLSILQMIVLSALLAYIYSKSTGFNGFLNSFKQTSLVSITSFVLVNSISFPIAILTLDYYKPNPFAEPLLYYNFLLSTGFSVLFGVGIALLAATMLTVQTKFSHKERTQKAINS